MPPPKVYSMTLGPSLVDVREQVRRYDAIGVDGVFTTDHLFVSRGQPRSSAARGPEPFLRLAAAGALSERMVLGTAVANIGLLHPALVLRQFLELASLFGGERVLAGIGAGWNPEEFDALGMPFEALPNRLARLDEASRMFRSVFDSGHVDPAGDFVSARDLPMGPAPDPAPRLLLGGGSDRMLEIAGRYADIVDLNGSSRRLKLSGPHPVFGDAVRRLTTTIDDLESAVGRVRQSATAVGRSGDAIDFSVLVSAIQFCSGSEVSEREAALCRKAGIDPIPLRACPYVFIGPIERVREQLAERVARIRLGHLIVGAVDYEELARFTREVVRSG